MTVYVVFMGQCGEEEIMVDIFDSKEKAVSYLLSLDWKLDNFGCDEDDYVEDWTMWIDGYSYDEKFDSKVYYEWAEIREWKVK